MWRRDALRTSNVERRVGFCRGGECRLPRTARPCACYGKENVPRTENAMYWGRSVSWGMIQGMSQRWLIDEGVEVCATFRNHEIKRPSNLSTVIDQSSDSALELSPLLKNLTRFRVTSKNRKNAYDNKKRKSSPDKLLLRPNELSLVSSMKS